MGIYYGVKDIIQHGKKIGGIRGKQQPRIQDGKALIGIASNADYLVASDMTSRYEYDTFFKEYARGALVAVILYEVDKSVLEKCPNKGRVDVDEFKHDKDFYEELLGI